MGFSTIFTSIIMFLAVIGLSLTLVTSFNHLASATSSSIKIQGDAIANSVRTDLNIESITYTNASDGTTIVYVKNIGKTKLNLDKIDLYLDGLFIDRDAASREIQVKASTDNKNMGILDPSEILEIKIYDNLEDGDHLFSLGTEYSFKIEEQFVVVA